MSEKKLNIAKNVRKYRNKKGISQDKLSKISGITLHAVTKIELGITSDPRIRTVSKIADALGVTVDDLLK